MYVLGYAVFTEVEVWRFLPSRSVETFADGRFFEKGVIGGGGRGKQGCLGKEKEEESTIMTIRVA
ncbi:hypothetical protein EL26_22005 [Tumebacillus flagellatus]|uniref:Uncharacterized protein n=1 Tax=Tumebacillus flagellatus TaxID=1157490 RepID=A0A074LMZ9_9BACL|nr:hypothetical protein EL26_22005 [Tumebacillus flagellatus]